MLIHPPLGITSRLLPGVRIGEVSISIEYAYITLDGRQAYRWFIDLAPVWVEELKLASVREFSGNDLCSGVGGGSLQEGLESLLGFLSAFASAIEWLRCNPEADMDDVENADLFPAGLADWAIDNADEISTLESELQENPGKFIVE